MRKLSLLLLSIVLLFGVGSLNVFVEADDDLPVLDYIQVKNYDPVIVGAHFGFFERRGVRINFVGDVLGAAGAIQAIASGRADVGSSSVPATVIARANGFDIIGVSDYQTALSSDFPVLRYYRRPGEDIETAEDLIGKTVGLNVLGSAFHFLALDFLKQGGVDPDDVNFLTMPFPQMGSALARGDVDIIGLPVPWGALTKQDFPDIEEVFNAFDVFGRRQLVHHVFSESWAAENPELARAFVAGVADTVHFILENQEEARQAVAENLGTEAGIWPDFFYQEHGQVSLEDAQFWIDFLVARGDVPEGAVSPEQVHSNDFNPFVID